MSGSKAILPWLALALSPLCGCRPVFAPAPRPIAQRADADAPFRFQEVAAQAGLDYRWTIQGKRPLNILQTIGNGCAFLDYNNDGNLDILLVGPRMALYEGDGRGHFTDVTRATGLDRLRGDFLGCAVGDYDNDGYEDIYLTAYRGGVLLHNQAGGRSLPAASQPDDGLPNPDTPAAHTRRPIERRLFQDVTREAGIAPQPWGTSASFVDIDNDGRLDLIVGNYVAFGPHIDPQICDFGGIPSACGPRYYRPEFATLYHNEGGGRFRDVTRESGARAISGKTLGIACVDYDGSGWQSIAVANDEMPGDLLQNTGRELKNMGASAGVALDNDGRPHGGMGIDWGDYDNDGKFDLAVSTFEHEDKCVYHNDGDGNFSDRSALLGVGEKTVSYVAFGVKFLDVDNDGWLDLIFTNGHVQDNIAALEKTTSYRQPCVFLHNEGGAHFKEMIQPAGSAQARPIVGRGLAIGDYDNDGKMDVLVVDSEGAPLLLHNVSPNTNHWLSLRLVGVRSDRDGLGALVTVETDGRRLLRRCATDGSYMSASDRRVHFGLGASGRNVRVTIRWPSGRADDFDDIAVDRVVTLREGAIRPEPTAGP